MNDLDPLRRLDVEVEVASAPSLVRAPMPSRSSMRTPMRSPLRSPTRSPLRSPTRSPSRTPTRSPSRTPMRSPTASSGPTPTPAMPIDVMHALTLHDDGAVRTLFRRAARDPDVRDEDVSRPLTPREQALRERALAAYHVLFATGLAPDNARPRWSRRLLEELVHHCVRESERYVIEAGAAQARPPEPSLDPKAEVEAEAEAGTGAEAEAEAEAATSTGPESNGALDRKHSPKPKPCTPCEPCAPPPQANAEQFLDPLSPSALSPPTSSVSPRLDFGFEALMTRGRAGLVKDVLQLSEIQARWLADWINRTLLLSHADAEFQASLLPAMRALLDDAPRTALAGIAASATRSPSPFSSSNTLEQQQQQEQEQQRALEQEQARARERASGPSGGPRAPNPEDRKLATQLRLWRDARVAHALARMVLAYAIPRGGVATFLGAPSDLAPAPPLSDAPRTVQDAQRAIQDAQRAIQDERIHSTGLDRDLITTIQRHARASFADHARAVTWTERWAARIRTRVRPL